MGKGLAGQARVIAPEIFATNQAVWFGPGAVAAAKFRFPVKTFCGSLSLYPF
jgi:hypothetical protein